MKAYLVEVGDGKAESSRIGTTDPVNINIELSHGMMLSITTEMDTDGRERLFIMSPNNAPPIEAYQKFSNVIIIDTLR